MAKDHIHQELNREVTSAAGHYVLVKEGRLPFQGREVLYVVGQAAFDTTCCGVGGCAYALVPGFVLSWRYRTDDDGQAVSQVEPIRDRELQKQVRRIIERKEVVQQVRFP